MKNIYLIVGASGTGKSSIVSRLVKEYGATEVLSYTDRPPRYEGEGSHTFVSKEEFTSLLPMVAYTEFSGHRYGVTSDMIDNADFYIIDPAGIIYLYRHYQGNRPIRVIGLKAKAQILGSRLIKRDGCADRIAHDEKIFTSAVMNLICDVIIDASEDLDSTVASVKEVIDKFEL